MEQPKMYRQIGEHKWELGLKMLNKKQLSSMNVYEYIYYNEVDNKIDRRLIYKLVKSNDNNIYRIIEYKFNDGSNELIHKSLN